MEKIYILFSGDYSDKSAHAAFSTIEKAEKWAKEHRDVKDNNYVDPYSENIEELYVDPTVNPLHNYD